MTNMLSFFITFTKLGILNVVSTSDGYWIQVEDLSSAENIIEDFMQQGDGIDFIPETATVRGHLKIKVNGVTFNFYEYE